ncbi:ChaN family lipoprotein [Danxiaibacter flavus]|uniref:ChaN family lipoprotein n=1 Tax=Danxiaibacter flavus TaxID=3049108 RepID=A0ABV3ZPT9_9BACT|nr:ChaN family lipoprotein [Chitinophagaceae bacterium DXS]
MKFFNYLFLFSLMLSFNQARSQSTDNYFKIYDTKNSKEITINEIAGKMNSADVLFFGEIHNDSVAHILEAALLDRLIKAYKNIVLSLEALSDDYQTILNEYLEDFLSEQDFERLANVWMPYYHSYKPLIKISKLHKLPVIAANVPKRYVSLVSERGMEVLDSLDVEAKSFLPPLPYYISKGKYYEKFAEAMKFHVYMSDSLFQSHCLYDATIAYNIYKFWKSHPTYKIFQIIGSFHVDERMGTIEQIKRLGNIKFLTISCLYDDTFKKPNWNEYKNLADFIIVTDRTLKRTF